MPLAARWDRRRFRSLFDMRDQASSHRVCACEEAQFGAVKACTQEIVDRGLQMSGRMEDPDDFTDWMVVFGGHCVLLFSQCHAGLPHCPSNTSRRTTASL